MLLGGLGRNAPAAIGGGPTWNSLVAALPGLWGWWKLDETAGAAVTATDSSGNARHGAYTSAGTQAAGLFSGSSQCQATIGSRIDVPDFTTTAVMKFAVGTCIKTTHSAGAEQQVFSADGSGHRVFQFYKSTSTHALGVTIITPSVVGIVGTTAINDGNPHFVMFVWDETLAAANGRMKIYVDGALDVQSTTAITLSASLSANLSIGSRSGGSNNGTWAGSLDEGIFCKDSVPSAAQIASLWAARNS